MPPDSSVAVTTPQLTHSTRLAVVGIGYVGLPVARAFSAHFQVLGFDSSQARVEELRSGFDRTGILSNDECQEFVSTIDLTSDPAPLKQCQFILVTVPTPISLDNRPDLETLKTAAETVGQQLSKNTLVVFESTVYPGVTEDILIPILEEESLLKVGIDFSVGYSPERINPGDEKHRLDNVVKVTSGYDDATADVVANLYERIVQAGVHRAPSIRVAEAAKVIENIQRDINIALVNEFAEVFYEMGLDTGDILEAAETKWNFLPFRPGLVGGHCIGVDPYYLTHKASELGYHAEVILAGREVNNRIPSSIVTRIEKHLSSTGKQLSKLGVLLMGLTFKENLPDVRNSKSIELATLLAHKAAFVHSYDPYADIPQNVRAQLDIVEAPTGGTYDVIIVSVAHDSFKKLGAAGIKALGKGDALIFDVKHMLPRESVTLRL